MSRSPREPSATPDTQTRQPPVAVMVSRFPAVTETFILREIVEMERQGQPVRLVPMLKDSPPVVHEDARPWTARALYTPYLSGAIVAENLRMLLRRPIRYLSLISRLKLGTIRSPGMFARTIALFPKSVFLAARLEREGIRHIHAHYATHPSTMALIVSELTGITFSFTVHAHDIQVDRSLLGWKLARARFIRSISHFNRRFLEDLFPHAKGKIEVVHVGIEPDVYEEAGEPQPHEDGPPRILCVAAHKPYKGLPVLIEACRILRDEGVSFRCEIIGHGPMHDQLAASIAARKLGEHVHLLGPRPQEEVARMMAEATLFALPSVIARDGQMEGIPVALMEAMASGRPVVSTMISGIPELVDHDINGLLVPPGDAAAFAEAMRTLIGDPHLAAEMGRRGREKVRREFTLRDCVAQLNARLARETR